MKTSIEKIRTALANGDLLKVEFNKDGSGAAFYFRYKNEYYDRMETQMLSLRIEEAIQAVAGFRFVQHERTNCM